MFCSVCGNKINGCDRVCQACGFNLAGIDSQAKTQLSPVTPSVQVNKSPLEAIMISYTFCGNCGRRNITGTNFCGCCGEKL